MNRNSETVHVDMPPEPFSIRQNPARTRRSSLLAILPAALIGFVLDQLLGLAGFRGPSLPEFVLMVVAACVLAMLIFPARKERIVVYEDRIVGPGDQEMPLDHVIRGGFLAPESAPHFDGVLIGQQSILGNGGSEIVIQCDRYKPEDRENLRQYLIQKIEERHRR